MSGLGIFRDFFRTFFVIVKEKKPGEQIDLKSEPKYHVGQVVWCFYVDDILGSKHYEATITRVHPDGKYDVYF